MRSGHSRHGSDKPRLADQLPRRKHALGYKPGKTRGQTCSLFASASPVRLGCRRLVQARMAAISPDRRTIPHGL